MKRLPKNGFGPPPTYDTIPPPFVHGMSFSLEETMTDQTNPTFRGLVFPGSQASKKLHAQNSHPDIVGIPLQFHCLEPNLFFHADFLLTGKINKLQLHLEIIVVVLAHHL